MLFAQPCACGKWQNSEAIPGGLSLLNRPHQRIHGECHDAEWWTLGRTAEFITQQSDIDAQHRTAER